EKKLQCELTENRSKNLISVISISPEQNHVSRKEKCQEISVTNLRDDRQNETNAEEPDEIEPIKSQYIEQGLIKELLNSNPIISSVIIPEYRTFQITTQSLVHLFHYALRSRHEEILAWYNYSDNFENRVIEICHELGVTDKTARMQLYKEMLKNLP
ncbi:16803_t:CDS:1, partial [Racocetra persica]